MVLLFLIFESQVPQAGLEGSNVQGHCVQPEYLLNDLPYRKFTHDNSIYTSLPGSDCDSQPYAKVGTNRSSMVMMMPKSPKAVEDFNCNQSAFDGNAENCMITNTVGLEQSGTNLIPSTLLPPPPSLPLPPPPEHCTPTPTQTFSLRPQSFQMDQQSMDLNSLLIQMNQQNQEQSLRMDEDPGLWVDPSTRLIPHSNPWFDPRGYTANDVTLSNLAKLSNISGWWLFLHNI